jgi:Stage II sporulation protein E (SpoIIE)
VRSLLRLRTLNANSLQALVRELPLSALIPLAAAIFLLFTLLGPVTDMMGGARQPRDIVIRNALLSGVIAIGYAFGTMRRQYAWVAITAAAHLAWIVMQRPASPAAALLLSPETLRWHLRFDAVAVVVAMVGSYSCFLWFMNGTAARYLRARAEIELAREIHQVLVPRVSLIAGGYEFSGLSVPSGDVGGDLVDVVVRSSAGPALGGGDAESWFGYVADVSGHGVSSGLVMGMFKSALRMRLLTGGPIASLLKDVNAVLFPLKSGAMYVTAACVRGAPGRALEYAVAGHLPILRVRASGTVEEITTPQIPIGMFEAFEFRSAELDCAPGDLLALITDGLTEVFDAQDREFGIDAIKHVLTQSAHLPVREIGERLVSAARAHGAQADDQTLLLIRRLV